MIKVEPYEKEPVLFRVALAIGILFWLLLVLGTLGVALIYVLFGFLFYLFVQSGFVAYLKGNAVQISATQYPAIYEHYVECCKTLDVDEPPRIYLLQSEGMLNALALRFLNRNFVVLYSSVVDALESHPQSLRFYMGHELCHIVRGHLKWALLLWPAKILPVLGPAYERAQESSCDRYGLACCESPTDAVRAMAVIASGPGQWRQLNVGSFLQQADETGGFWMSFHEITGSYPWLSKRVARIATWSKGETATFPRRNPFAWLLSVFVPNLGLGVGGPGGFIILIAIIGILAAVAIPAYQDYTIRAKTQGAYLTGQGIAAAIEKHVEATGNAPADLQTVGVEQSYQDAMIGRVELGDDASFTLHFKGVGQVDGKTMTFVPFRDAQSAIQWTCSGGTLQAKFRPNECRQ